MQHTVIVHPIDPTAVQTSSGESTINIVLPYMYFPLRMLEQSLAWAIKMLEEEKEK